MKYVHKHAMQTPDGKYKSYLTLLKTRVTSPTFDTVDEALAWHAAARSADRETKKSLVEDYFSRTKPYRNRYAKGVIPCVYQRGARWQVRVVLPGGRTVSKSGIKTQQAAAELATQIKAHGGRVL